MPICDWIARKNTPKHSTYPHRGIALALIPAVKSNKCIITLSKKMSQEKASIVACLGARIVRTPAGVPIESPHSIISVAKRLQKEIPNSHILDQYGNPNNPLAHELGTAEEIWAQTQGKVDVVIAGPGTGGRITGMARGLRKRNPGVFVIGADPVGSVLAVPEGLNEVKGEYKVEGIGYDFVPEVCDQSAADLWVKTTDKDSFLYSRQLIREERLLCGGSSGATVAALVQSVKERPEINVEGKTVVLILPDGVRNYLTKFADDRWMENFGYMPQKDGLENESIP
jgi:cystathionine beta-synthase